MTPDESGSLKAKALQMALAISRAEGYGADPDNKPTRQNNPLDLTVNGVVATYPTYEAGLEAGLNQVIRILSGHSKYYRLDESILSMAATYTGGTELDTPVQNWAHVVASGIGVDIYTTLSEYVNG